MNNKTHYRKVFKSDHLGVADLEDYLEEGKNLIFTVKNVKQEIGVAVAGHKGNFNIAYFVENIKPLVLNATNSKMMRKFCGGSPFVENWNNIPIELYVKSDVRMKGETVGGVRIKPQQPILKTREQVLKEITACKTLTQLNTLRPEISKYDLSAEATLKSKEL